MTLQEGSNRPEGHEVSDETIAHLSPARFETINPYGGTTSTSPRSLIAATLGLCAASNRR